jgi:uncharacterized protein YndB with AHSA1/START domain
MTDRDGYTPGPAQGAQIRKDGDKNWTLVLVRELRHAPEKVWVALTNPAHLRQWAPFEPDGNLSAGSTVKLTTLGAVAPMVSETTVTRADEHTLLQYNWGGNDMRWVLEAQASGTRLTLWTSIDRRFIAMGAAGWHICFDVMDRLLAGTPIGRIAGGEAMQFDGWKRLHGEYAKLFALDTNS